MKTLFWNAIKNQIISDDKEDRVRKKTNISL